MHHRWFALRISLIYAALFVPFGVHLPFFPVWLAHLGFDGAAIGLVLAVPMFARVLTTALIGALIDRWGDRRAALVSLSMLTACSAVAYLATESVVAVLVVATLYGISAGSGLPTIDAVALLGARRGLADFGRMRLWGSVSFIGVSIAAGWIVGAAGPAIIIGLLIAGNALQVAAAMLLPALPAEPPTTAPDAAAASADALGIRAALGAVWRTPGVAMILVGAAIVQASHGLLYSFGSLHWASQGHPSGIIGMLWATGVLAEIGLFSIAGRIVSRVGALSLIGLGAVGGVVRFTLMPLDLGLGVLFVLQATHALSFAASYMGMMYAIAQRAPAHLAGTTQGLVMTVTGGSLALCTSVAGPLYTQLGAYAFWVMAGVAAVGGGLIQVQALRERTTHGTPSGWPNAPDR